MSQYFFEMPYIHYDVECLQKIVSQIPDYNWYTFSCNNIRWTVREVISRYRLECKNIEPHPFFDELFSLFKGNLSYDRMLFSKTPPPGVPKHTDRTRNTIINFPIVGNFVDSPQSFWENFDSPAPLERFYYHKHKTTEKLFPYVFDGQQVHSVENATDEERTILSIWFDVPFNDVVLNKQGIKSLIDINYNGKYIKCLEQ